jgi:acetate CoA/acetoacetate CoA-transferase alpha subunit
MVGGFGRGGTPFTLLEQLADMGDSIHDLTVIKNDASEPDLGIGPLFKRNMVRTLISTHIGLNPDLIERMNRKEVHVELFPQGIFAEKIRAAGAGIPGILTDIGIDTHVAEGKPTITLHNATYLIEEALPGDLAFIYVDQIDTMGNCRWKGSNCNMNMIMGTACRRVVAEAAEIVETGCIPPEDVQLPGLFIHAIVKSGQRRHMQERTRK